MSNESKHTPAPWNLSFINPKVRTTHWTRFEITKGVVIAHVHHISSEVETEANARLIAAAPKMYEALKAIEAIQNGEWDNPVLQKYGSIPVNTEDLIAEIAAEALKGIE